jgi:hypothetical protein
VLQSVINTLGKGVVRQIVVLGLHLYIPVIHPELLILVIICKSAHRIGRFQPQRQDVVLIADNIGVYSHIPIVSYNSFREI